MKDQEIADSGLDETICSLLGLGRLVATFEDCSLCAFFFRYGVSNTPASRAHRTLPARCPGSAPRNSVGLLRPDADHADAVLNRHRGAELLRECLKSLEDATSHFRRWRRG